MISEYVEDFDTRKEIKDLQQQLALKDLEIMRLREALGIAVDYQQKYVNHFSGCYYEKDKKYDDELAFVEQSLSILATYDDLMAWHEAQLGEPVAFAVTDFKDIMEVRDGYTLVSKNKTDLHCLPLYAKKG